MKTSILRICLLTLITVSSITARVDAQGVSIEYQSTEGTASVSPITVPNPDTGLDITITPTISIDSGSFEAQFQATSDEQVVPGLATFTNLAFSGAAEIALSSSIQVFGFPVAVTANLSGPISATQVRPSIGRLEENAYVESTPGLFNLTFGPLTCSDSAFGVFCGVIENTLEIELPIESITVDEAPLPFAVGTFEKLNAPGTSAVSNELTLAFPLGEANSLSADVRFTWSEVAREFVVPEPASSPALWCALTVLLIRRVSPNSNKT